MRPYAPCILSCGRTLPSRHGVLLAPSHRTAGVLPNNHWHLILIRTGEVRIDIEDGPSVRGRSSQMLLLPPGLRGRIAPSRRMAWLRAAFHLVWQPRSFISWGRIIPADASVQPSPLELFGTRLPLLLDGRLGLAAHRCLDLIHRISWRSAADHLLADAHLGLLIAQIAAEAHGPPAGRGGMAAGDRLGESLRLLERDQLPAPGVAGLAQAAGLSPSRLRQVMRAVHGTAPRTLLRDHRMRQAMEYLRDPGLSVGEVARRCAYADAAAFIRAFRRCTGATPGRWRRTAETTAIRAGDPASPPGS